MLGVCEAEVADAWLDITSSPKRLFKNCRFFFTELGWDTFGRNVVKACMRTKTDYTVVKYKECKIDVFWKDKYQVAGRVRRDRYGS